VGGLLPGVVDLHGFVMLLPRERRPLQW